MRFLNSRRIVLSKAEQRTLRSAVAIADRMREVMRSEIGDEWAEDHAADTELCLIGAHVDEVIDGIDLPMIASRRGS